MNYNELSKKAHEIAAEHGFWKEGLSDEHYLTLVFSEVGEAIEAHRKNKRSGVFYFPPYQKDFAGTFEHVVKDTLEDEFADIMIRLFDLAGGLLIDFDRMPECRYYRAFERFSFTENAFGLIKGLAKEQIGIEKRVLFGLKYVEEWASQLGIDLPFHVGLKMAYNEQRPYKHDKAY
jgi:NTP pyrophosphatase (non-canonical NTP hydrolase)